jgi:hypothetical protein
MVDYVPENPKPIWEQRWRLHWDEDPEGPVWLLDEQGETVAEIQRPDKSSALVIGGYIIGCIMAARSRQS